MSLIRNKVLFGTGTERVGVVALFLFALFSLASSSLPNLGLTVLFVVFVLRKEVWSATLRNPLTITYAVFLVYVGLRALLASQQNPESTALYVRDLGGWVLLFPFVLLAWIVSRNLQRAYWALLFAGIGLLLRIVSRVQWHEIDELIVGAVRSGFGISPSPMGLYSAVMILGLLVFAHRLLAVAASTGRAVLLGTLWLGSIAVFGTALIASQARGVWLATALAAPFAVFSSYRVRRAGYSAAPRAQRIVLVAGALLLGAVVAIGLVAVGKRTAVERTTFAALLQGEIVERNDTSLGFRLHMYRFGIAKWQERPWFGWGPGASRQLIRESGNPGLMAPQPKKPGFGDDRKPLSDLHNFYLEVLVSFGVVGALLGAFVLGVLFWQLRLAYRRAALSADLACFLFGSFGMVAIYSLFGYSMVHTHYRFFLILLVGIAFGGFLADKSQRPPT